MGRGKIERRGSKPRRTKSVMLIVTEGEKTEPKYFGHYLPVRLIFALFIILDLHRTEHIRQCLQGYNSGCDRGH